MVAFSLRASNLNCIGVEPQGFDEVRAINVIVGRNNAGKSSLIDMVQLAVKEDAVVSPSRFHAGQAPTLFLESIVTQQDIEQCYPASHSNGDVGNYQSFGKRFIGARITCSLAGKGKKEFCAISKNGVDVTAEARRLPDCIENVAGLQRRNLFWGKEFRRLAAERNILPESDSSANEIRDDGQGATNVIQKFLNKASLPRDLVRKTLLDALNTVFNPDTIFEEILCRQLEDGRWEIFLKEKEKGLIPLSQSGSGLKTVILALSLIHLEPFLAKMSLSQFVIAFEELENNLHPALQRRLISYLANQAVNEGFYIFLTTHSSVSIDILNRNKDAQIVHVTHDGKKATSRVVRASVENYGVLDDLDVRASDLLQANGVIWLEEPSDRVFINRWISLWAGGTLIEGNHYQCIFYGGRLLSHLSADPDGNAEDGVSILRVNRNAALIMDSDRRIAEDEINSTKQRMIAEIQGIGGIAWVTSGKEIENHVPVEVLKKWIAGKYENGRNKMPGPFESIYDALEKMDKGLGKRYVRQKPLLAEELGALTTREDLVKTPDLARELDRLCAQIRLWNRLPEPAPV